MQATANNRFEIFFRAVSYGVALCGLAALSVTGAIGLSATLLFFVLFLFAWLLEGSRWQLSEKAGVALIFLIVPLFYFYFRQNWFGIDSTESFAGGYLAWLILALGTIKLLQRKVDRDWVFIYLIAFFQMLLATGISISPFFLISFGLFVLFIATAIIAFEIRKSSRIVQEVNKTLTDKPIAISTGKLPVSAIAILCLIVAAAVPLFFMLPRVGGANLGSFKGGNRSPSTGFSDTVRLGEIGELLQSDEVVMRVKLNADSAVKLGELKWRGVGLDYFDRKHWIRSSAPPVPNRYAVEEPRAYKLAEAPEGSNLVDQQIYLEPMESPVLFTLEGPVQVTGKFTSLSRDLEGSLMITRSNSDRLLYHAASLVDGTPETLFRQDNSPYTQRSSRHLQLPDGFDQRIGQLAQRVITESNATNRFAQAVAIEMHLKNGYAYSLEMTASGDDPVADFLFNVKAGHCEYFASSMVLMLRSQGIAARVVNGFNGGEYNDLTGFYVVKQKHAHSWVEVYFPGLKKWKTFDPTPISEDIGGANSAGSWTASLTRYFEALETMWMQYVISYDTQEQRSLFKSVRSGVSEYENKAASWVKAIQMAFAEWWKEVRGDLGGRASLIALVTGLLYLIIAVLASWLLVFIYRRFKGAAKVSWARVWRRFEKQPTILEFYRRMLSILEQKGWRRKESETPLEFAASVGWPEVISITELYNGVRFGQSELSKEQSDRIDRWLDELKQREV